MKTALMPLLCVMVMSIGLVYGMGDSPQGGGGEDEIYDCYDKINCNREAIEQEIFDKALICYDSLLEEDMAILYQWASEAVQDIQGDEILDSFSNYCNLSDDDRRSMFDYAANQIVDKMTDDCKEGKEGEPPCKQWKEFTDCLSDIIGEEKEKKTCGSSD